VSVRVAQMPLGDKAQGQRRVALRPGTVMRVDTMSLSNEPSEARTRTKKLRSRSVTSVVNVTGEPTSLPLVAAAPVSPKIPMRERERDRERLEGARARVGRVGKRTVEVQIPQNGGGRASGILRRSRERRARADGSVGTTSRQDNGTSVGDLHRGLRSIDRGSTNYNAKVHRVEAGSEARTVTANGLEAHRAAELIAVRGSRANLAVHAIGVKVPLELRRRRGDTRRTIDRNDTAFGHRSRGNQRAKHRYNQGEKQRQRTQERERERESTNAE